MGKAIQESKRSKKLNTNEETGPSNSQANTDERSTQAGPSNEPVVISDDESSNSDSSIDTEYQYVNGIEDQALYYHKLRKNYENKNSDDPSFATELEVYKKAQEKELKSVSDKLSDFGLSEAERRWHEGRQTVIVKELEDTIQTKETLEALYRNEQRSMARLYDDEGLGKTPSPSPEPQTVEDSEDNNSSDSDEPDGSGPSPSPSNPGPSTGPGDSGPTGEEGSNGSYRIIIPSFVLNFVAEVFEHISNIFFF
jgi:hypothetical protein